ncbi:WXG100 family type VII secretion target [Streptomyces iconiensis]|uniref:ESAT-6-like protein n=1 Tax=Streptomyces iconiensis TaxID=1384038 RepID=A0ABT7A0Q5_9ACTN|nr:WXG100 family type VII secretion target [Streptomyces iconiensis]MDJ1134910.1 WXG100 family type VII secretion target [Streptomyces iconiensis]
MPDNLTDGYIYVSYSHVDNAVDDMRLQTREIEKIINSLNDELQALKNSWEGEDRAVYDEKQAAWNQAVTNMATWLNSNASTLNDIRDLYSQNERQQTQSWQDVKIG